MIGGIWSIAVIFEGLSTVHDYDFKQTVVSLIITAVFMLIAAIVVLVVIIMWEQLYDILNHSRKGDNKKCYRQLKE